jgi:dihydroorotase
MGICLSWGDPEPEKNGGTAMMKRMDMEKFKSELISSFDMTSASAIADGAVAFPQNGDFILLPSFCDVHVHFREPGFFYKESMETGSASAARGGYTAVCTMPNLNPVPDSKEHLEEQLRLIRAGASIGVYPYGAITVGEKGETLADLDGMAADVIGFSDDGRGVQNEDMMRAAMEKAKALGKVLAAHCEVNSLLFGGYIHDGAYAKAHGHKGICSASEYEQVARDLKLAKEIGVKYHVCHISAKETVDLIRKAKADGVDVTCETAPHYLILDDSDLREDGKFKMNPPLRDRADKEALIEGILDGTIDMIATDHAPHSREEKSRGLQGSAFGVVGLETAFPAMYTHFVRTGILSMEALVRLMAINPRKRFGIPLGTDFTVWDLSKAYAVDPNAFHTKGRATPFDGMQMYGESLLTVYGGKVVYKK